MTMHALRSPSQAYRRIEFDARVAAADPRELVMVCYDQLGSALARAVHADARGDNQAKSEALTRALSAIAALQLGIDPSAPMAEALGQFYTGARRTLLDSVLHFDADVMGALSRDVADVARALAGAD